MTDKKLISLALAASGAIFAISAPYPISTIIPLIKPLYITEEMIKASIIVSVVGIPFIVVIFNVIRYVWNFCIIYLLVERINNKESYEINYKSNDETLCNAFWIGVLSFFVELAICLSIFGINTITYWGS